MNRLTKRHNTGVSWNGNPDHSTQMRYRELLDRLAAYEDTGLTPEEAAELAKAKADGRLVVLPCKVGDTVYKHWKVGGKTVIGSALVTGFEISKDGINYCFRVKTFDRKEPVKKFGKTVFLTREEAEVAPRKEQGDETHN